MVSRRAKTPKGRRFLEAREPKLVENTKTTMFIRGGRTSEIVTQALKDLVSNVLVNRNQIVAAKTLSANLAIVFCLVCLQETTFSTV